MENFTEKREFPRIKLKRPLGYRARGTHETNNTISENISLGGICFVTERFIAPKTALAIEIDILTRMLCPIASVVWSWPLPHSDRYHVGVEFLEFNQRDKNYLSDYIDCQAGRS